MDQNDLTDVQHRLEEICRDRWMIQYAEIQDQGLFLMISLALQIEANHQILEAVRKEIYDTVDPLVPERDDGYSWMVALNWNGAMVQSVMGGWTAVSYF